MFQIDAMSRQPVYEQLIDQIEHFILAGLLNPNDKIPSVRNLAVQLSVNPNTIQKAYSELDRRGIIYSVPGRGCFISDDAHKILSEFKRTRLSDLETLINELILAGVTKEEIISCIENIFNKKGDLHDD
ncbi:GntR family transcriptional regulator [Lachnospiraceae bacterium HCP1S3_C3]|nr:GntR family transcriptional regulator [Lachnospiraceae bacterium]MDD6857329.1 GntR family transcriptional regulator [Lachnospiraceae bacterium]